MTSDAMMTSSLQAAGCADDAVGRNLGYGGRDGLAGLVGDADREGCREGGALGGEGVAPVSVVHENVIWVGSRILDFNAGNRSGTVHGEREPPLVGGGVQRHGKR